MESVISSDVSIFGHDHPQALRLVAIYSCHSMDPRKKSVKNSILCLIESHGKIKGPRWEKTGLRGFQTRSDTNRPVQSQKQARSLKFRI